LPRFSSRGFTAATLHARNCHVNARFVTLSRRRLRRISAILPHGPMVGGTSGAAARAPIPRFHFEAF